MKFLFDSTKNLVTWRGTVQDVANCIAEGIKGANKTTVASFNDYVIDESGAHNEWAGGSLETALTIPSLDTFLKAKQDLVKSGILRGIKPESTFKAKRRRVLSEHDGDWSFERRWDLKPFSSTHREQAPVPHIEILADFSISGMHSSKNVDEYGAYVWSIAQILEDMGVSTTIGIQNNTDWQGDGHSLITVIAKQSGTYISPQALAQVFRSCYYRRAIFGMMAEARASANKTCGPNFGRPTQYQDSCSYNDGVLHFKIGCAKNPVQTIEAFKQIFGGTKS